MKTIGEIKALALALWNEGYKADKKGNPIDKSKPLIPAVIAERKNINITQANAVNHLLVMWSLGKLSVGQYAKI